jgi:[acyl-carrier-protein] S-malonyltransferase
MAAILGLAPELVRQACTQASDSGTVEVANYNCPGQIVIAGETNAVEKAMELCRGLGAKRAMPLQVSGPFHSSLMVEAGKKLAVELENVSFSEPSCPLIANVTADTSKTTLEIKELLVKQISSSVRWEESMQNLASLGITNYIEVGPGKVLCGLGKKIIKDMRFFNFEDTVSLENILANLKEVI